MNLGEIIANGIVNYKSPVGEMINGVADQVYEAGKTNAINTMENNPMKNNSTNAVEVGQNGTYYVPNNYAAATSTNQGIQNATAMDYYEYLSNTEMQRRVLDMTRAGLNPVLTATGGGGASSSTSAMSNTTKQTQMQNKTSLLNNAISLIAAIALRKG